MRDEMPWDVWFHDMEPWNLGNAYKLTKVLYSGESRFQRIDVFEHEFLGRMLVLYGAVMMTERFEFIYHEMLVHPAMFVHPRPSTVLVVGGGDGCTLREVLRHHTVSRAVLVEIDEKVVGVAREYLEHVHRNSFDDTRVKLVFQDAAAFLENDRNTYDVILSDCSDPVGPAEVLFREGFFQSVKDRLSDHGVFAAQTESPMFYPDQVRGIYASLRKVFPVVRMYAAYIPTYPGAMYSFAFCSKGLDPIKDFDPQRVIGSEIDTRYYNADLHDGCFRLPTFASELAYGKDDGPA